MKVASFLNLCSGAIAIACLTAGAAVAQQPAADHSGVPMPFCRLAPRPRTSAKRSAKYRGKRCRSRPF